MPPAETAEEEEDEEEDEDDDADNDADDDADDDDEDDDDEEEEEEEPQVKSGPKRVVAGSKSAANVKKNKQRVDKADAKRGQEGQRCIVGQAQGRC